MRKDARECAFKLIFESFFRVESEEILDELKKEEDAKFAKEIYTAYKTHKDEI